MQSNNLVLKIQNLVGLENWNQNPNFFEEVQVNEQFLSIVGILMDSQGDQFIA